MAPTISIDGTDVTNACVGGSWTRRLNRPSQAQVRIPFDEAVGGPGSRLLISNGGSPVFHGFVLLEETGQGEDFGYMTYNAQDPMELWQWRPVRADDGDFSKPAGSGETNGNDIIATYLTGPEIMEAALKNTEGDSTAQGNQALTPPADSEGPTFLTFGTFETGGVDLTGAPVDWPMTIAQFSSLLMSTGELDLVITPTNPGGGVMGTVDGHNGDYGTDLSATVVFEYGTGAHNMRSFRRARDMTTMSNKIWYYAGPRIGTAADPAGDQHWCFNIVATDPVMLALDPIPNGQSVAAMIARRGSLVSGSQFQYGVRMDIQIFDQYDDGCVPGFPTVGHQMLQRRWQSETWIRSAPRDLVHVTPTRESEIGNFDIGDLVGIEIPILGVSAAQRVYAYTVSWDDDGVLALSELQSSDTADS